MSSFLDILKKGNSEKQEPRNNALFTIFPYYYYGWVFDDETVGLIKEPFVLGVPEIIDMVLRQKGISEPEKGFKVIFSAHAFPQCDVILERIEEEDEGNWYIWAKTGLKGWLCPALFCYFEKAPDKLFVKVEDMKKR